MAQSHSNLSAIFTTAKPQVIAALYARFKDLDLAEDGFQESCIKALASWEEHGLPHNPTAWLIVTGKHAVIDHLRKQKPMETSPSPIIDEEIPSSSTINVDTLIYRDDILRLFFICCHPSLPQAQQLALALRLIADLSLNDIAKAFLVKPSAMEKRITRAKDIAATVQDFDQIDEKGRRQRLASVTGILYLMFNEGYTSEYPNESSKPHKPQLCLEAIRLCRLLLSLYPDQYELMGLLALFLFQFSRQTARTTNQASNLHWMTLEQQDRALWDKTLIQEADVLLQKALRGKMPGPYQLEAAIAGTHCQAKHYEDTNWQEIERLYVALEILKPTPIVKLNRAAVALKNHGPAKALTVLRPLEKALKTYPYYHGLRGEIFEQLKNHQEAINAYQQALELTPSTIEKQRIQKKIQTLMNPTIH